MDEELDFRLAKATVTAVGTLVLSGSIALPKGESQHRLSCRFVFASYATSAEQAFPAVVGAACETDGAVALEATCAVPLSSLGLPPSEPVRVFCVLRGPRGERRSRVMLGGTWRPYPTSYGNLSLRRKGS